MVKNNERLISKDKELTQFARLRYKEGCTIFDKPTISARKLAEKLGISTGLVSKLESEDILDMEYTPCTASVIKKYHDEFDCSYEYLMGETDLRKKEYYDIGKDTVFGLLDDTFYDKFKELLSDDQFQRFNIYMLRAFMNNPKDLQDFMVNIFIYLYKINAVNSDTTKRKVDKEIDLSVLWFSLNNYMKSYFEKKLLPDLQYGFKLHEDALIKRQEDEMIKNAADREQLERQMQTADLNITVATTGEYEQYQKSLEQYNNITNIHITP